MGSKPGREKSSWGTEDRLNSQFLEIPTIGPLPKKDRTPLWGMSDYSLIPLGGASCDLRFDATTSILDIREGVG